MIHSAFVDILAVGALAAIGGAVYYRIRSKAEQQPAYKKVVAEQKAEAPAEQKAEAPAEQKAEAPAEQKAEAPATFSISGNSGLAGCGVYLAGDFITATIADAEGNFAFSDLAPGTYHIFPAARGHLFKPSSIRVEISNANIKNLIFEDPSSVIDSRQAVPGFGPGPNSGVTVNGTIQYTGQTSSNPAIPPVDSRVSTPVACGTYPQNSRR